MNAAVEAVLAEREFDQGDEERMEAIRPQEKFRMAVPGRLRQINKRPKNFNGIHRRRQKKVIL
jgi:hypothetical protein